MRLVHVHRGVLDERAVEGVRAYQRTWPGEIVVVSDGETSVDDIRVVTDRDIEAAARRLCPDAISALMVPSNAALLDIGRPVIFTAEFDRRIRTDIHLVSPSSMATRARIVAGQFRLDAEYRKMARSSAGLQCNGGAAWAAYGHLNSRPMKFHDHRIHQRDLAAAKERDAWDGVRRLRVAFSGRVTAMKGTATVIDAAHQLPEIDFAVLGDGDQRQWLESMAPDNVSFMGWLPFGEWKEYFRSNVDVALLPHPQGDPSCTYFEAMGSGVPVVGLANSTWGPLVKREKFGWAERSTGELVRRLRTMQPKEMNTARERGLAYLRPYEEVAAARVEHFLACTLAYASKTAS